METYLELDIDFPPAIARDGLADPQQVIAPDSILWKFCRSAYQLGYHAAMIPTEFGGLGLHGLGMHVFLEELGWGSAGLAISLGVAGFPCEALAATGNRDLIDRYVKPFVADREAKYIGCWPVTEPAHGSDWGSSILDDGDPSNRGGRVIARREGDDYVINGQKAAWVSNGTIATHGLTYLMAASNNGQPRASAAAFVPFDLPGVSKGKPLDKLGQRALNQGEIFFDNVRIPDRYVLATPGAFSMAAAVTLTQP